MIRIEDISVGAYKLRYLPGVLLVLLLGSCTAMDSEQGATGGAAGAEAAPSTTVDAPVPLSKSASSLADQTVAE